MSNSSELKISDNFTMEDIRKIREHSYRLWLEDPEAWRKDLNENSAKMHAKIERIKEARRLGKLSRVG